MKKKGNNRKFQVITLLIVVAYILSFVNFFADMRDGNRLYHEDKKLTGSATIPFKIRTINQKDLITENIDNSGLIVRETQHIVRVIGDEYNDSVLMFFVGLISLGVFCLLIWSVFVLIKFLKNLFNGIIITHDQIMRLRIIGRIYFSYAFFEIMVTVIYNYKNREAIKLFPYELIVEPLDFSIFFIPLILLLVVEIMKQHLQLKEEQELTI